MQSSSDADAAPPLPSIVDARLRRDAVTLPLIQQAIPASLLRPSPWRSWWALIRVVGSMGICISLLSLVRPTAGLALLWQVPVLLALWVLYGWVLVGLFLIGHDCGHHSFSTRSWVNSAVGYFCLSPLANSFHTWRLTHRRHHAYTQLRGVEPDWETHLVTREEFESPTHPPSLVTRLGYALPFGVFLWIYWNMIRRGVMTRTMLPAEQYRGERVRLRRSEIIMCACLVVVYGGLWSLSGFWGMLKYLWNAGSNRDDYGLADHHHSTRQCGQRHL